MNILTSIIEITSEYTVMSLNHYEPCFVIASEAKQSSSLNKL